MSVYVDNARIPARVRRINGRWSHLTADTPTELHRFAQAIGLRRGWFQVCKRPCGPGACVHWHYDVTDARRAAAITAGAQPIDLREWGEIIRRRRQARE